MAAPEPIRWDGEHLELLDQRRLPHEQVYLPQRDADTVAEAIRTLTVRGAPAIGIAAAYGLVVAMQPHRGAAINTFRSEIKRLGEIIAAARPTAVNLRWAVNRLIAAAMARADNPFERIRREAEAIHSEDRRICRAIGEYGQALIQPGIGVLTHCNAGALAVSELGTATAPLYLAFEAGVPFRVFVDETRPLLQGARLTAWELLQGGLDVTLLCDNMAARLMAEGEIDLVIVGTDRVVANGDVINKIGTSALAIISRHFEVPFYVACPSSTFDADTATGAEVTIEERDPDEVSGSAAPPGVKVRNPAFDVTPFELVTALITDAGIIEPPFASNLSRLRRVP
jgi:methylthioribose-1-phosphate isomerase